MEFKVETADRTGSICIECERKIERGQKIVRIFKKASKVTDCFYHAGCFVNIHKEQFKSMCPEIVEEALMKK